MEKEEGNSREVGNYKGQVCLPVAPPVPIAVDTTLCINRCNTNTSIFLPNSAAKSIGGNTAAIVMSAVADVVVQCLMLQVQKRIAVLRYEHTGGGSNPHHLY